MTTLKLKSGDFIVADDAYDGEIAWEDWLGGSRPDAAALQAGAFALIVPNDVELTEIGEDLNALAAIILEFPEFKDGRAYSQARLLRDRYGYKGEIRARGDVLCDQALFMTRSGFTALEIGNGDQENFQRALKAFSYFYQAGADGSRSLFLNRVKARAAA